MAKSVSITQLKNQLLEKVDTEDLVQLEKVERYIELVKTFRVMSKAIKNGGESSTKIIGERNKINASLLSIEKSFVYNDESSDNPSLSDLI